MHTLSILNSPWAIVKEKLEEIQAAYTLWLQGEKPDVKSIEAQLGRSLRNEGQSYFVEQGVAVIAIDGILARRINLLMEISGGTSTQMLSKDFKKALADPDAHSIVLAIDSPGGSVEGIPELAAQIFEARGKKPIMAIGEGMMASAGYWLAAAADRIFITGASTQSGSIGVVARHIDRSRADEARGVKVTEITAGRYKAIASETKPLTREGFQAIQDAVDYFYSLFVNDVAKFRGRSAETVLAEMADGRTFIGKQAVDAGLADGITTLPELIGELNRERDARANSWRRKPAMDDKKPTAEVQQVDVAAIEKAGFDKGITEGAKRERERIQSVEAQLMPGHEDLIATLKYDGKTSGPEAAVQVLAADKKKRGEKVDALKADAPKPVAAVEPPVDQPKAGTYDANEIGAKAEQYRREQSEKGIQVSAAAAVNHVMKQGGLKPAAMQIARQ